MKFISRVLTTTCYIFTSITVLSFLFEHPLLSQIKLFGFSFSKLLSSTTPFDLFVIALMAAAFTMTIDQRSKLSEGWKNLFSYLGTLIVVFSISYLKGYSIFSLHYLAAVSSIVLICYSVVWLLLLIQSFKVAEEINQSLKKINH
ncbi:hypothetical protein ATZ33_08100 [Enterococcus silesiacus]|uniref:DUF3021 domain-containing protein n=2 Tax=Enterococcus silesiacus TaxID=332949 RepID=A0ABN4J5W6_9ENTE|nr:hypothetical protein [Enterococcus silesiacus]ALS01331.1 hypothetical protein ATZ33_08100 [Enterococcus silesiacus]